MTTKTISGYYKNGYTLSAAYSALDMTSTARVLGNGVVATASASIANHGTVDAFNDKGVYGIKFEAGGYLYNAGHIYGGKGVWTFGPKPSTINNHGSIGGYYEAVLMSYGGSFNNAGFVYGDHGPATVLLAGTAVVSNSGFIGAHPGITGVSLKAGSVTNSGTITSGRADENYTTSDAGIYFSGVGTVTNTAGVIESGNGGLFPSYGKSGAGIDMRAGGVVTNSGGTIAGGYAENGRGTGSGDGGTGGVAIYLGGGAGSVITNKAHIIGGAGGYGYESGRGGTGGVGIDLAAGGSIVNTGTTLGGAAGVAHGSGAVGVAGNGVDLTDGGSVVNGSSGAISALIGGQVGVYAAAAGAVTLTNFGTIEGAGGKAVLFKSPSDVVIVEAGCVIDGSVNGGRGTLVLATGTGTLTGLLSAGGGVKVSGSMARTSFTDFATVEIGSAARFATSGAVTLAAGQSVINSGTLTLGATSTSIVNGGLIETNGAGGLALNGGITNNGTLVVDGGTLRAATAVTGTGTATVEFGTLAFTSSFNENVVFTGGVLELAQSQDYTASIAGFSTTEQTTLDLGDIGFVRSSEATFSGNSFGGVLTVTDGTHTAHINLTGFYLGTIFVAASDGHGGTTVVDSRKPGADPASATGPWSAHQFIAAAAGLGAGSAAESMRIDHGWDERQPMLTEPRTQMA